MREMEPEINLGKDRTQKNITAAQGWAEVVTSEMHREGVDHSDYCGEILAT